MELQTCQKEREFAFWQKYGKLEITQIVLKSAGNYKSTKKYGKFKLFNVS